MEFISPDPAGFESGPNLYAYANNDPVNFVDPDVRFKTAAWNTVRETVAGVKNHPTFQGGVQAAGGVFEAAAGATILTGGAGATMTGVGTAPGAAATIFGYGLLGHGVDNVAAGVHTAFSGQGRPTVTNQILQGAGMSSGMAAGVEAGASMGVGAGAAFGAWQAARAAKQAENAIRLRTQFAAHQISQGHAFGKHVLDLKEFPGWIRTRPQFQHHLDDILNNPTTFKNLQKGRTGYWHEESGTVIIRNPTARDAGTAFQPGTGRNYYETKLK